MSQIRPLGPMLLVLAALAACDERGSASLTAVAVTTGSNPLHRNENLEILFSRVLRQGTQPPRSVRVSTAAGEPVRIRTMAAHRLLSIQPQDPDGWPLSPYLEVEVPFPALGPAILGAAGEENAGAFHARIPLRPGYLTRPGTLEFLEHGLDPNTPLDFSDPETHIRLQFSADLDPSSLVGVQVIDVQSDPPVVMDGLTINLDPEHRDIVRIWTFDGGTNALRGNHSYRLQLTSALRSLDGRGLAPGTAPINFTTSAVDGDFLVIRFRSEDDLDVSSRAAAPADARLRPIGIHHPVEVPRPGTQSETVRFEGLFGRDPSRAQIVIPGSDLPRARCLIKSIIFESLEEVPDGAMVDQLEISLGYFQGDLEAAVSRNQERVIQRTPLSLGDGNGQVFLRASGEATAQLITIRFDHPFVYDGSGASLLLDVENKSGTTSPWGRINLAVAGSRVSPASEEFRAVVQTSPEWTVGTPVQPRMFVITRKFDPVMTRWYETSDGANARFRRVASGLRARGEEPRDFLILFQGGRRDARGVMEALTPFSASPPRDCAAVRLKIEFEPRSEGEPTDEELPWIESITLHSQQ